MLKRITKTVCYTLFYVTMGVIIAVLVLAMLFRFALLDIDHYSDAIQQQINQHTRYPVNIGTIDLEWVGWNPYLLLSDVHFFDKEEQRVFAHLQKVRIDLNPARFLGHEKPLFILSSLGVQLDLVRNSDDSFILQLGGMDIQHGVGGNSGTGLSAWLLDQQAEVILQGVQLSWTDQKLDKDTTHIANVTIQIKISETGMQIDVDAPLLAQYGDTLQLKMNVQGNLLTPNWSGQVYIAANNLMLQPFLPISDFNIDQRASRLVFWSDWQNAQLMSVDGIIHYQGLDINGPEIKRTIPEFNAVIAARRINKDDWIFGLDTKEEQLTGNNMPSTAQYTIQRTYNDDTGYTYAGRFKQIKIDTVMAAIKALSSIRQVFADWLEQYHLQGDLQDLVFSYTPTTGSLKYKTRFSTVTLAKQASGMMLNGLSGMFSGDQKQFTATIDSAASTLVVPSLFTQAIQLASIRGQLGLSKTKAGTIVTSPLLTLHTADFPLLLSGKIHFPYNQPIANAAILASFTDAPLDKLAQYLPKTTPRLKKWFDQVLLAGTINNTTVLLRGPLTHYPYSAQEGVLKVVSDISGATIKYHSDWPSLDRLNTRVKMENNNVTIQVDSGRIYDADIKQATIHLLDVKQGNTRVTVNSKLAASADQLALFIKNSPLVAKKSLLSSANNLSGGRIALDLSLNLGLPPYAMPGTIAGKLHLFDNQLTIITGKPRLQQINGTIHFTQDAIDTDRVNARYDGKAITLELHGRKDKSFAYLVEGLADHAFILRQLMVFTPNLPALNALLKDQLRGESRWRINGTVAVDRDMTQSLLLQSDLHGIALDLPTPFEKKQEERRPFSLHIQLHDNIVDRIQLGYGELDITIDTAEKRHDKRQSIQVRGKVAQLSLADWFGILGNHFALESNKARAALEYDIDITAKQLFVLSQEFSNVRLKFAYIDDSPILNIEGEDIQGELRYTDRSNTVIAHLKKLALKKELYTSTDAIPVATTILPALQLQVDALHYDDLDLGEFHLRTKTGTDGIKIEKVTINKPGIKIEGTGDWKMISGQHRSHFDIRLHAEKMANVFALYGHTNTGIGEGETRIRLDLNWDDALTRATLEKLQGTISVTIGNGMLEDVRLSAANRLLGLLSLQALPHWMRLDFSGLFGSSGFAFHSITGNFDLERGHAYTNDLLIKGSAADIAISGRTGLLTMDYDQIVTVNPNVVDSFVLISPLFGPVGLSVGATLFLFDRLFTAKSNHIDTLLNYQYAVTGSWATPSVKRIKNDADQLKG